MIETVGNQNHIFASNKLRENVGASQQLWELTTTDIEQIVNDLNGTVVTQDSPTGRFPRNGERITIWYLSSGKALLFAVDPETARTMVRSITLKALRKYPGVALHGVISPCDFASSSSLKDASDEVHRKIAEKRATLPPPQSRFARLPIVAECRSSSLPAAAIKMEREGREPAADMDGDRPVAMSRVTLQKRTCVKDGEVFKRFQNILADNTEYRFARTLAELEGLLGTNAVPKVAVVHADGMGIGKLFQNLLNDQQLQGELVEKTQIISEQLDCCTRDAFRKAISTVAHHYPKFLHVINERANPLVPVAPLIIGGDDVTFLCDGRFAVALTVAFLRHFEECIKNDSDLSGLALQRFGVERLGMCAGIAITSPNYPFHAAYQLADDLQSSAKKAVKARLTTSQGEPLPCTAFDFHVHHASSGEDLESIERSLSIDGVTLRGGPYLVTENLSEHAELNDPQQTWSRQHLWADLELLTERFLARKVEDPTRPALPPSQWHLLREALFQGPGAIRDALDMMAPRYPQIAQMFKPTDDRTSDAQRRLLDAMSLAKLTANIS